MSAEIQARRTDSYIKDNYDEWPDIFSHEVRSMWAEWYEPHGPGLSGWNYLLADGRCAQQFMLFP